MKTREREHVMNTREKRAAIAGLYLDYPEQPELAELCKGRSMVPGHGNFSPEAIFIGEAPGQTEDRVGRPFAGRSGKTLDAALEEAGLKRERLWVTNAVKYRPVDESGNNRTPDAEEIVASAPYLHRELGIIGGGKAGESAQRRPLVVALGRTAAYAILGKQVPVGTMRGKFMEVTFGAHGIRRPWIFFITFHPSALRTSLIKRTFARDIDSITVYLNQRS